MTLLLRSSPRVDVLYPNVRLRRSLEKFTLRVHLEVIHEVKVEITTEKQWPTRFKESLGSGGVRTKRARRA